MENKLFRYNTEIKIVQSSVKRLNPQFSLCDVLVCYHGDNRNGTSLPKNVIENNLYSIYGVPIIGEWIYKLDGTDEQTWGSHGGRIILDDKGIHFEQTTKPFGFVTKEAADNATWITLTEKDGHTQKEYLKLSGCILWTERYEESKSILDQNYGQSMEIEFKKGHYRDDHYYEAEEFIFSALCILGTDVEPCFESACIGRHYEIDSFKKDFSLMLDEYKKINKPDKKEEMTFMDLDKLKAFLSTYTIGEGEDSNKRYTLIGQPKDNAFTVIDQETFKVYSIEFALDDDKNIVADWDSKVEKKFSVVDSETENGIALYDVVDFNTVIEKQSEVKAFEITESFKTEIEKMSNDYKAIDEQLSVANRKVAEFESERAETERAAHKVKIDGIVTEFAKKLGRSPKFLVYKAKLDANKITANKVTEDLTLMVGQEMVDGKTNFSYQPQETKVNNKENEVKARYGNLLDKYMK